MKQQRSLPNQEVVDRVVHDVLRRHRLHETEWAPQLCMQSQLELPQQPQDEPSPLHLSEALPRQQLRPLRKLQLPEARQVWVPEHPERESLDVALLRVWLLQARHLRELPEPLLTELWVLQPRETSGQCPSWPRHKEWSLLLVTLRPKEHQERT